MEVNSFEAPDAPSASGGYSQAFAVTNPSRIVYISGQIPVDVDDRVPAGFEAQARLAWKNVERQLVAAGMSFDNLIKHTTFLARRDDREANSRIRQEILEGRSPALTVVIAEIYDEAWLLEIEAVAAD